MSEHNSSANDTSEIGSHIDSVTTNENDDRLDKTTKLSSKEMREVRRFRYLVLGILIATSVIVCVVVFVRSSRGQDTDHNDQFGDEADQITKAFQEIVTTKLTALGSLRLAIMAEAIDKEYQWPNVTISSFEKRSATALKLSKSIFLGLYPIVNSSQMEQWDRYYDSHAQSWIKKSLAYQQSMGISINGGEMQPSDQSKDNLPFIIDANVDGDFQKTRTDLYIPQWQSSPLVADFVNTNLLTLPIYSKDAVTCIESSSVVIGEFHSPPPGGIAPIGQMSESAYLATYLSASAGTEVSYNGDPISSIILPIYGSFEGSDTKTVALIMALVRWGSYFDDLLSAGEEDIEIVLENTCNGPYTYIVKGNRTEFVGKGDLHNAKYNNLVKKTTFEKLQAIQDGSLQGIPILSTYCPITLSIYPTTTYNAPEQDNTPGIVTLLVALGFGFVIFVFLAYDRVLQHRQKNLLNRAKHSQAIVSSLFPQKVAERLLQNNRYNVETASKSHDMQKLLEGDNYNAIQEMNEEPIADLFPNATVLFADVAGFTAWSSTRDPTQVFVLLQALYQAFDAVANRRKVFKVETIGDSYVAVTGLPEPQPKHALIMARFASECQVRMKEVVERLSLRLGPGTSELAMRVGINSGPVTAGVLRGERARFQLFGDTVNTASRMESTGLKNKIQVALATATLLNRAGKSHWITPREDQITAKGKGTLKTFWLDINNKKGDEAADAIIQDAIGEEDDDDAVLQEGTEKNVMDMPPIDTQKIDMLVDWVCELLQPYIRSIISARKKDNQQLKNLYGSVEMQKKNKLSKATVKIAVKQVPLEEVVEALVLPEFKGVCSYNATAPTTIEIEEKALVQLRDFIRNIALSYRNNPFHNFEHACHVTMSVSKLLLRVVTPTNDFAANTSGSESKEDFASNFHDYTHGINSDPVTIFAILISGIIHDVDHRGVSNAQLIIEEPEKASVYSNKSVAEQNSIDIAWTLLMSKQFDDLRNCLFETKNELQRFRQVLVTVVLATDIFDTELNNLRKKRWAKAFDEMAMTNEQRKHLSNIRATIVIEHLIQASDVAHTMQHWHVYRKWNTLLFHEMCLAHQYGRMNANPADFWYEGELKFFDNYIIPLAQKLKECNVFGVSSDEYLNYAEKNRAEWEVRGQEIVAEMIAKLQVSKKGNN